MKQEKGQKGGLLSLINGVLVVEGEMVDGGGEDSKAYMINERYGFFGVFDGCGGIGSRRYEEFGNKTGAYIASRVVSSMSVEWFKDFCNQGKTLTDSSAPAVISDLRSFLLDNLKLMDSETEQSMIRGSLTKKFPTTGSFVICEYGQKALTACFGWAGDSRGYILAEHGLTQITADDVDGGIDAMSNLSDDGRLTNVISANGDFKINYRNVVLNAPAILITATDGCFGYFSTPMEFEYMILETLAASTGVKSWNTLMDRYIRKYTGDDYTMCVAVCGYSKFETLKKAYANRKDYLYRNYISKLERADANTKAMLWEQYRTTYSNWR